MDNAEESELKSVAPQIDISNHSITKHSFEPGERSLHCITNTAFALISFFLFLTQRPVSSAFVQNAIKDSFFPASALQFIIGISLVGKESLLIAADQLPGLPAVMHAS